MRQVQKSEYEDALTMYRDILQCTVEEGEELPRKHSFHNSENRVLVTIGGKTIAGYVAKGDDILRWYLNDEEMTGLLT
jgi:hypothetical protein